MQNATLQQTVTKKYILTKQAPSDQLASSSTVTNSSQTTQKHSQKTNLSSSSSVKIDNDPTPPVKNFNPSYNQLIDSGDNFAFDNNIEQSSQAGGTPS